MQTIIVPEESEVKKWVREAINEYFDAAATSGSAVENNGEALLSRKQIVGYLDNISLVTLHAWMKQGLPYHKQGGRVYFLKSEVLEYIKTRDGKIVKRGY